MTTMIAYHGDQKVKAKYLARVRLHQKADQIVQGQYWESGKGCAVGCTIHGADHAKYEIELGIPRAIARLEDRLFEHMAIKDAKKWPARFLSAIKPGADLSMVVTQWLHWCMIDTKYGVLRHAKNERTRKAIKDVAGLLKRKIDGDNPTDEEWEKARANAYAAAAADAYATDAADAAAAAADAAAYAAAAYAAADAYAADATYAADAADARQSFALAGANYLIELLRAAPMSSAA